VSDPTDFAGRWSQVEIAGHLADIYEPPTPSPQGFAAIYLHGVHQKPLTGAFCRMFDRFGWRVCCPRSKRSWWTDKICSEFDPTITAEKYVLTKVLPWMAETWQARPPRIGIFGTSMGGQGALRMAFKHPDKLPVVAAISPAIDYQLAYDDYETIPEMYPEPEAVRQDTATLHVHPLNWPRNLWFCCDPADERWHESSDRLHMKLYSLGIPHEFDLETTGGGHSWAYYDLMSGPALEFIAARLEQERLRLPVAPPAET
jgi:pimeloyl-ACP methyl ester carboxylesterase